MPIISDGGEVWAILVILALYFGCMYMVIKKRYKG